MNSRPVSSLAGSPADDVSPPEEPALFESIDKLPYEVVQEINKLPVSSMGAINKVKR
jgi:hypothetical protein